MYLLNENYLFDTRDCTSIEFKLADEESRYLDTNRRCMVVEYTEGMKYSDLSFRDFTPISEELITPHVNVLRRSRTVINGVLYRVNINVNFIACYIINNEDVSMENSIVVENKTITILLGSRKILNWGVNEYIEFLNSYKDLFNCEVLNEEEFNISSFEAIDLTHNANGKFNRHYEYIPDHFYLNESKIVSQFVMFMQKEFPKYTICGGISDLTNQEQKTRMLVYNAKLFDIEGDIVSHVRKHPLYNRIRTGRIQISWEFITDDFDEYVIFRDKMLLNTGILRVTNFQLDGDLDDWWYSVEWQSDVGSDIERAPASKLLSDNLLYSIPFSCELYGWIAIDNKDLAPIIYPVKRFYNDKWKLFGSLFNKNDVNTNKYYVISSEDGENIVLTEDDEGSINSDNLTRIVRNEDDFKVILEDEVVNPLHFGPGTTAYAIDPRTRRIIQFNNDSIIKVESFSGVKKLVINMNKFREVKS